MVMFEIIFDVGKFRWELNVLNSEVVKTFLKCKSEYDNGKIILCRWVLWGWL